MMEPSALWVHVPGVEHSEAAQPQPGVALPQACTSEAQLGAAGPASMVVSTQNCAPSSQKVVPQGNSPGGEAVFFWPQYWVARIPPQ